jgi:hypothetical protein
MPDADTNPVGDAEYETTELLLIVVRVEAVFSSVFVGLTKAETETLELCEINALALPNPETVCPLETETEGLAETPPDADATFVYALVPEAVCTIVLETEGEGLKDLLTVLDSVNELCTDNDIRPDTDGLLDALIKEL